MHALVPGRDFAREIRSAWQRSVEGIIETGRLLVEAKSALAHGAWIELVGRELPFAVDTASRLMAIARHPRLSNSDHDRNLPPSWQTLYQISRIPDDQWERAERAGVIRPDVPRGEVMAFLRGEEKKVAQPQRKKIPTDRAPTRPALPDENYEDVEEICLRLFRLSMHLDSMRSTGRLCAAVGFLGQDKASEMASRLSSAARTTDRCAIALSGKGES